MKKMKRVLRSENKSDAEKSRLDHESESRDERTEEILEEKLRENKNDKSETEYQNERKGQS